MFCTVVLPKSISSSATFAKFSPRALRLLRVGAIGLAAAQAIFVALDTAMLMSTSGLGVSELYTANYFLAGLLLFFTAVIFLLMTRLGLPRNPLWLLFLVPLMFATVWTSHGASRLEHQIPLMLLTGSASAGGRRCGLAACRIYGC